MPDFNLDKPQKKAKSAAEKHDDYTAWDGARIRPAGTSKPKQRTSAAMSMFLVLSCITLSLGISAWVWTAEWRWAATGTVLAFVLLVLGAAIATWTARD